MKFIDTSTRNPNDTVGHWLSELFADPKSIKAIRIQTGYFDSLPLHYLHQTLTILQHEDKTVNIVIGSNGGSTKRSAVEDLLRITGKKRAGLKLAIAAFQGGLYHPKAYHFERADRSETAYIGSANFTFPGITGQNIETGIILDTRCGDDSSTLRSIASSVDSWFQGVRQDLIRIDSDTDLDTLEKQGLINIPTPQANTTRSTAVNANRETLQPLIRIPSISITRPDSSITARLPQNIPTHGPAAPLYSWGKKLPKSDAQRKPGGNQSGVIALTQADLRGRIDHKTYFRTVLFGNLLWRSSLTKNNFPMDVAEAPIHTTIFGKNLGTLTFKITHDPLRERDQDNYTTTLHLDPIRNYFASHDMTDRHVEITLDENNEYWLSID